MENKSYHGTDKNSANDIIGPPKRVDVNKGKGELGKGFYTGSSLALAAIWAQIRYKERAVVIEFDVPKSEFVKLKGKSIKTSEEVNSIWDDLKNQGTKESFEFNHDYVIAPFATIEHTGFQLKFESKKAESTLNASNTTLYPCE